MLMTKDKRRAGGIICTVFFVCFTVLFVSQLAQAAVVRKETKPGLDVFDINCKESENDIYNCYDEKGAQVKCVGLIGRYIGAVAGGDAVAVAENCVKTCKSQLGFVKSFAEASKVCGTCLLYSAKPYLSALTPIIQAYQAGGTLYACSEKGLSELKKKFCDKGSHGCCIADLEEGKEFNIKKETCTEGVREDNYYTGDCFCIVNGADEPNPVGNMSPQSCEDTCKKTDGGRASTNRGVGRYLAVEKKEHPDTMAQFINVMCFTQEECSSEKYGGTPDAFVPNAICPSGKGKCLAPEPEIQLSSPVLGVSTVKSLKNYILLMFRYILSIVVIAAAVMFVYGGFKYIFGSSMGSIESAKETMVNATIGLVATLGAVAMLNTINPATTNLNRLDIYLMKQIQYSNFNWCKDYKGEGGKALKFGDAGNPPGSVPYDTTKFAIEGSKAVCGVKYYPEGFGGKTCDGEYCSTAGRVCISCKGGEDIKECVGNPQGFACAKAVVAGSLEWANKRYPKRISIVPVCKNLQPATTYSVDSIKNAIVDFYDAKLFVTAQDQGSGSYIANISPGKLQSWEKDCDGKGGLDGFLLAVQYNDPFSLQAAVLDERRRAVMAERAKAGFAAGVISTGPFVSLGAAYGSVLAVGGAISAGLSADDMAIVAKYNCAGKGGKSLFAGYVDGGSWTKDKTDAVNAIYCGWTLRPGDNFKQVKTYGPMGARTFNGLSYGDVNNPFFNVNELKTAVTGETPIKCDIGLDDGNAPTDPGSVYLGCCTGGSSYTDVKDDKLWCK